MNNSLFKDDYLLHFKPNISSETIELVNAFLSEKSKGLRYIMGRTETAEILVNAFDIDVIIDDYSPKGSSWKGLPVINRKQVPQNAIIVNCAIRCFPSLAFKRLKKLGLKQILKFSDFCYLFPEKIQFPQFVSDTRKDFEKNKEKYENVWNNLADIKSKQVFEDVLKLRLTGDYDFLSDYKVRAKEQYFEDFLYLQPNEEVFADCGGFDGDTTKEFIKNCPTYKKIYFFEPWEEIFEKAKIRLKDEPNIEFINKGVSDKNEVLNFNISGFASSIDENGKSKIHVTSIDKAIKEKISFIKMDVEGSELKAIEGAKNHILQDKPRLAIAIYHIASHIWEVFEAVKKIQPNYDIYLRHYTEGWDETIMFFMPKKP